MIADSPSLGPGNDEPDDQIDRIEPQERHERGAWTIRLHPVMAALLAAIVIGAGSLVWSYWPRTPREGSVEVGFTRDMAEHHRQGVQMALIIRERTGEEQLRALATDIVLTQQAQIGVMDGWLLTWDVAPFGDEPAMTWMGHPTEGLMPGMATAEEIQQLRDLPVADAEVLFLRLMIRHHRSAVAMSEELLDRSDRREVRFLADNVISTQEAEIQALQNLLVARGQPPEDVTTDPMPGVEGGHDH